MYRRIILVFTLLLLVLILVPSAAAKPPDKFEFEEGWWGNAIIGDDTLMLEFRVVEIDLYGWATQPRGNPGRANHGTFEGTFRGYYGKCDYSLVTFTLPNDTPKEPFRATMYNCSGELEGFHLNGTGGVDPDAGAFEGPWQGKGHFKAP